MKIVLSFGSRLSRLLPFGFLVLLVGCAVLTVDVDVYKGPLVNDDATQMDQVIALTLGAKPLVVDLLHQTLEALDLDRADDGTTVVANRYSPYLHQVLHTVPTQNATETRRQTIKQAIFLNELLGL